jgi:hypothetical protein
MSLAAQATVYRKSVARIVRLQADALSFDVHDCGAARVERLPNLAYVISWAYV